jgi:hypothetical protein
MPGIDVNNPNDSRIASGSIRDGWIYDIERVPKTDRFRVTVVHPYGDAPSGGTPWPIEDPLTDGDPAHPTYPTVEEAISAAQRYVDLLSDLPGYPDPALMSARGFRPTIW